MKLPSYKIIDRVTFINGSSAYPGAVVEYAGWPGSSLEPIDDVAKRIKAHYALNRSRKGLPRAPDLAAFAEAPAEAAPAAEPPKRGRPFTKKVDAPVAQEPTDA